MPRKSLIAFTIATCLAAGPLAAEDDLTGYRADFLRDFDRASKKLAELADAMPADAFGWRLTDEVRSVSEIFIHVAESNFLLARDLGVPLPEDWPEEPEQAITAKDQVTATLDASVEHVRRAVEANADLDREIELFGRPRSVRSIFMILAGHSHEHLGQAIAYARAKGVVPPWSRSADG